MNRTPHSAAPGNPHGYPGYHPGFGRGRDEEHCRAGPRPFCAGSPYQWRRRPEPFQEPQSQGDPRRQAPRRRRRESQNGDGAPPEVPQKRAKEAAGGGEPQQKFSAEENMVRRFLFDHCMVSKEIHLSLVKCHNFEWLEAEVGREWFDLLNVLPLEFELAMGRLRCNRIERNDVAQCAARDQEIKALRTRIYETVNSQKPRRYKVAYWQNDTMTNTAKSFIEHAQETMKLLEIEKKRIFRFDFDTMNSYPLLEPLVNVE